MMAMARLAIIFSLILSLFLLSHARQFGPHLAREDTSVAVGTPEENSEEKTNPHPLEQSNDGDIPTIERMTLPWPRAVRLRRSTDPRFHRMHVARFIGIRMPRGCRHPHRLVVTKGPSMIEVPYGNDMIRFPGRHGRDPVVSHGGGDIYPVPAVHHRNGFWKVSQLGDAKTVRTVAWDGDAEVVARKDKEEEKQEKGGFMERFRGFLSRFAV